MAYAAEDGSIGMIGPPCRARFPMDSRLEAQPSPECSKGLPLQSGVKRMSARSAALSETSACQRDSPR